MLLQSFDAAVHGVTGYLLAAMNLQAFICNYRDQALIGFRQNSGPGITDVKGFIAGRREPEEHDLILGMDVAPGEKSHAGSSSDHGFHGHGIGGFKGDKRRKACTPELAVGLQPNVVVPIPQDKGRVPEFRQGNGREILPLLQ